MKTCVILLSVALMSHDIVQASLNAWGAQFDEVKLLNVTEGNEMSLLKEELSKLGDQPVIIADASVMPLRKVPVSLMAVPFLYQNDEDRYILPFYCLASDALEVLKNQDADNVAELRMKVAELDGHEFPFETEWQTDNLLMPVSSKNPNERLLWQFVQKKYFIRFKKSCVGDKNIQFMRKLFPPQVARENSGATAEEQPADEGEKKDDDDTGGQV